MKYNFILYPESQKKITMFLRFYFKKKKNLFGVGVM